MRNRALFALTIVLLAFAGAVSVLAQATQPIDWDQARALLQRDRQGQTLSPEERAYLGRAQQAVREGRGPGGGRPGAGAPTTKPAAKPTGLVPLTELATNQYKGQTGGLYGQGRNEPPAAHLALAKAATQQIRPLDAEGKPAADGKVVLLAIGMSNTTQEFSVFKALADRDADKHPSLVIVDGAQGGQDATRWCVPGAGGQPPGPWAVVERRMQQAGVTARQVQVVFVKQALIGPARLGEFPKHADELQARNADIVRLAREHFPHVRLAYLTGRTFAGYATTQLNPEPYAYESAFAVRGLILDQIKGDAALNADPARGPVKAPVLLWGPYLWTDGPTPRQADGLTWLPEDTAPDGTHPSDSGRRKVGELLLKFFKSDALARTWFVRPQARP